MTEKILKKSTNSIIISEGICIGSESPPVLFAGPCVIESEEMIMKHAEKIKQIAASTGFPFVFKASYDKANRSSITSFRGPGIQEGLRILQRVRNEFALPIITDAHTVEEIAMAGEIMDVIQIPAFLCRQTDIVSAAAKSGCVVNVKKGQFLAPNDMKNIIDKITASGSKKIIITERGVSFGYNRLIVDFTGIVRMREFGYPVIFDATHSVQSPGSKGDSSGGDSSMAPYLSWASAAVGVDGLFLETHLNPDAALCDGANMIPLNTLENVLIKFKKISEIGKNN